MQTVAIVGVGLIGASFGLAIRKAGFSGTILGVSSAPAIAAGLAAGAIDASATLKEAADKADLIYLAQPVDRIIETIGWLGPMARKETLITDAGSTKSAIVKAAFDNLQNAQFIGGHPMAGKETRGAQSASADLFRDRPYVLTPEGAVVPEHFKKTLKSIGADVVEMSATDHDATVALTSHLPQLLSTALAAFLSSQPRPQVFGSGLLDMTRLALSPIEIWESILATNKGNVLLALDSYIVTLEEMKQSLQADELGPVFQRAMHLAANLRGPATET